MADITYVPTWAGFLYLAVVLDVWSRRVVGWAMADHLRTELVLDALNMAIEQRRPTDVIHHSDQGCQYTSIAFGKRCKELGVRPSMGSVGDCYDNALCESFFATLECELIDRSTFRPTREARLAVFDFIEGWYNPHRRHSGIGECHPSTSKGGTSSNPPTESVNLEGRGWRGGIPNSEFSGYSSSAPAYRFIMSRIAYTTMPTWIHFDSSHRIGG